MVKSKVVVTKNKQPVAKTGQKLKRDWPEYIAPFMGVKWGAVVTLIGYTVGYHRDSLGLVAAASIVGVFTLIEWTALAWSDFKRRASKNDN